MTQVLSATPEILLRVRLDFRNAVEDGALEIELHHHAQCLREAGVHADGEIQSTDASLLDRPGEGWQRLDCLNSTSSVRTEFLVGTTLQESICLLTRR